jgi:hypothetical protein
LLWAAMMFALLGTAPALADDCSANACDNVKILRLYVSTQSAYILIDGDTAGLNCTYESSGLKLLTTHSNYESVYSLLLAHFYSGQNLGRLRIRINEGSSPCTVLYAWVVQP